MARRLKREMRRRLRFPAAQEALFVADSAQRTQRVVSHTFPLAAVLLLGYAVVNSWLVRHFSDPALDLSVVLVALSIGAVGARAWRTPNAAQLHRVTCWVLAVSGLLLSVAVARTGAISPTEPYGLIVLHLVYVFFMTGLLWGAALRIGLITTIAYVAAKLWFEEMDPVAIERIFGLLVLLLLGGVGVRILEMTQRENWRLSRQLAYRAYHDSLTDLLNRRALLEQGERRIRQARREGKPVTVIMLDIDYFKHFNDRRGHLAGDRCLRRIAARVAAAAARPLDLAGRFGGEEMVLLLYDCPAAQGAKHAETLRRKIAALGIRHPSAPAGHVTVCLGVSARVPRPDDTMAILLAEADTSLYAAKSAGRDRVVADGTSPG